MSRRNFLGSSMLSALGYAVLDATGRASAEDNQNGFQAGENLLLKGGCVVTLDKSIGDFERADVLIEGSKIKAIQPQLQAANARVIDAYNTIVMPGFVDSHNHLYGSIFRDSTPDEALDVFFARISALGAYYRPNDIYAATLLGAIASLDVGITTVLNWSHVQTSQEHTDEAIHALKDAGIRALFADGYPGEPWNDPNHHYPEDLRRLRNQYFSSNDHLLTLAAGANVLSGTDDERVLRGWKVARELGAHIAVHVGWGANRGDVKQLNQAGLMGPDVTYIHCNNLSEEEWKMIADTGGSVSSACLAEMLMGHGRPAIQKSLDHGIRPSLGVDFEAQVPCDMFAQMRSALSLQHEEIHERSASGEKNPPRLLTVREVLEFATIEGAKALQIDHRVGTLTPSKEADVILLRMNRPNVMPLNNPVGAVVLGSDSSNVDTVLVAGKIVKQHGRLVGIDLNRLGQLASAARDHVLSHAA